LRVALSKGPNRVGVSLPLPEDENIRFPKSCFLVFRIPDDGKNPENPITLIIIIVIITISVANCFPVTHVKTTKIIRKFSDTKKKKKERKKKKSNFNV
jgi:hypothetical protein